MPKLTPREIAARAELTARALAGWKVLHTGGGMFVAVKDYPLKDGSAEAAVVLDGDAAVAYRRPDGWIRADEYVCALGHVEDAEEVVLIRPEGEGLDCSAAEDLFGREAADEMREVLLSEVWD